MKTPSSFSVRLDEKVIMTMIIVSVLASFFTAFRYKSSKPCVAFEFSVYANYFNVGHFIFFKTNDTRSAEKWEWDFGDKSATDSKSGPIASHIYKEPGQYLVTLTINGKCKQYQNVVINNVVKDSIRYVEPQVLWPLDPVFVGQNVVFKDVTNGANRWEWYVGEGIDSKRFVTKDVPYVFSKPGSYVVKLFVNGNIDAKQERMIKVINDPSLKQAVVRPNIAYGPVRQRPNIKDAPDAEPLNGSAPIAVTETKPQNPQLTKEIFTQMIQGVVEKMVVEKDFDIYMCGNSNVRVSFNGEDISFHECIVRLQKLKKLKSLKAIAFTDPGTNCIQRITIATERKKFIGIF